MDGKKENIYGMRTTQTQIRTLNLHLSTSNRFQSFKLIFIVVVAVAGSHILQEDTKITFGVASKWIIEIMWTRNCSTLLAVLLYKINGIIFQFRLYNMVEESESVGSTYICMCVCVSVDCRYGWYGCAEYMLYFSIILCF